MKKTLYILIILTTCIVHSQTAFQNHSGSTFQLHSGAEVGFHVDLVNQGTIEDTKNTGFAGFYSTNQPRIISGKRPIFHDVWIQTFNDNLELKVSLGVTNELTFVEGRVLTPKTQPNAISLDLIGHQSYFGADDDHYIDGYNTVISYNNEYTFPIGDDERLRPMILPVAKENYKGAYFFEDAELSSFFNPMDRTIKAEDIEKISAVEYWALVGDTPTEITLTWDMFSEVNLLIDNIKDLTVVGWNKAQQKWIDLGRRKVSGDIPTNGKITSLSFSPNDYTVITLGSSENKVDNICGTDVNTFTPDGDDVNDTFKLPCAGDYPDGSIYRVYDRLGSLVFLPSSITESWDGLSNINHTVRKQKGLPSGVYFYLVIYTDKNGNEESSKGWIYLVR